MSLLLPILLHLAQAVPAPSSCSATGVVLGSAGRPLVGARVLIADRRLELDLPLESEAAGDVRDAPVRETFTDDGGRFTLEGLVPGTGRLVVRAPGHATLRRERVFLAARGRTDLGDLALSSGGILSGSVRTRSGEPIAGARIWSFPERDASLDLGVRCAAFETETNADGAFDLTNLELGEWTLLIEAEGRAVERFEGSLLAHEEAPPRLEFVLGEPVRMRGHVQSPHTVGDLSSLVVRAVPLVETGPHGEGAELARGFVTCDVESGGAFVLEGVRPDTPYLVRAQRRGDAFDADDAWAPVRIVGSDTESVRLRWLPSASLALRAFEIDGGGAPRELTIELADATPASVTVRPEGETHIVIEGIRPRRSDGETARTSFVAHGTGLRAFESRELNLRPGARTEAGDVALWARTTLTVRVFDAEDRMPLAGARVTLRESPAVPPPWESSSAETDAAGRARVDDFPGRPEILAVAANGYGTRTLLAPFELVDEEVRIALDPAFDLGVTVVDSDGEPVPGTGVSCELSERMAAHAFAGSEEARVLAYTDVEGTAWFHTLGAGPYDVVLEALPRFSALHQAQTVLLDGGPLRELRFGLDSRTRVEGRIVSAGTPLAGAEVVRDGLRTRTDENGAFAFDAVRPGTDGFRVSHPARALDHFESVDLEVTPNTVELNLPATRISGIVADANGVPIQGAELYVRSDRWSARLDLSGLFGANLVRGLRGAPPVPVAWSDENGSWSIEGLEEMLGLTVSALAPDGSTALARVRNLRSDTLVPGVELILEPPCVLRVEALNEPLESPAPIALVLAHSGESRAGCEPRVVVPYTGQGLTFAALPPGDWRLTLATLDAFGALAAYETVQRVRLEAGGEVAVALDR